LNHEALKGEWSGAYRRRIGDYRVIYAIDHETKSVVADVIGHRRDVYIE
jgi:mRNA interferase RelE/StbE